MRSAAVVILLALAACNTRQDRPMEVRPGSAPRSSSGLSEAERNLEQAQEPAMGTPTPPGPPDPDAAPPAAVPPADSPPPKAAPAQEPAPPPAP